MARVTSGFLVPAVPADMIKSLQRSIQNTCASVKRAMGMAEEAKSLVLTCEADIGFLTRILVPVHEDRLLELSVDAIKTWGIFARMFPGYLDSDRLEEFLVDIEDAVKFTHEDINHVIAILNNSLLEHEEYVSDCFDGPANVDEDEICINVGKKYVGWLQL